MGNSNLAKTNQWNKDNMKDSNRKKWHYLQESDLPVWPTVAIRCNKLPDLTEQASMTINSMTHLLCGLFIRILQSLLLLVSLLLQRLTDQPGHFTLGPWFLPTNQEAAHGMTDR